jgi:transposase
VFGAIPDRREPEHHADKASDRRAHRCKSPAPHINNLAGAVLTAPWQAQLASRTGRCPGNHESAGKRHHGRPRPGNQHLQSLLVECAWSAVRHDGYLKSLCHRHVLIWGGYRSPTAKKKAIIVVAHALIVVIWHILATAKPCQDLGADYFTTRLDPERETRRPIAKPEALGHQVTLQPAA